MLDRLGVFVGGFDLAAAEAVCGAEPLDPDDVLDLLGSLVEKSLVTLEERDEGARYAMLETIREYAREKLAAGDEAAATAARHCEHYFAMAKERIAACGPGTGGMAHGRWKRSTTTFAGDGAGTGRRRRAFVAVKFAVAMQGFWILRGYSSEGRSIVRAALALPAVQESDLAQAWALYVGAALAESQSDHAEARSMLETCLVLRRRLGNPTEIAATLSTLSLARLQEGDAVGAMESEREALATSVSSATASARRSACCISGRSASTWAMTSRPGRSSSSASRSRAPSSTRRSRASANSCSAKSASRAAISSRRACASSGR